MTKLIKLPDARHFISIVPSKNPVVVTVAGRVIADTSRPLLLRETSHPPVLYIPRKDIDMALLMRSEQVTYCPYKGDCAYYSIMLGGERSVNAAWSYEAPHAVAVAIRGYLAFYPDRVDSIVEWPVEYGLPLPGHGLAFDPMRHVGQ